MACCRSTRSISASGLRPRTSRCWPASSARSRPRTTSTRTTPRRRSTTSGRRRSSSTAAAASPTRRRRARPDRHRGLPDQVSEGRRRDGPEDDPARPPRHSRGDRMADRLPRLPGGRLLQRHHADDRRRPRQLVRHVAPADAGGGGRRAAGRGASLGGKPRRGPRGSQLFTPQSRRTSKTTPYSPTR